jgi:hypothetical protein
MDPNFMVVTISLIFASLFITDRVTDVFKKKSFEEQQTQRRLGELNQIKDMTSSAKGLLEALHGGAVGEVLRTPFIDMPEEKANGAATRYTTPAPANFPQHRATAPADR